MVVECFSWWVVKPEAVWVCVLWWLCIWGGKPLCRHPERFCRYCLRPTVGSIHIPPEALMGQQVKLLGPCSPPREPQGVQIWLPPRVGCPLGGSVEVPWGASGWWGRGLRSQPLLPHPLGRVSLFLLFKGICLASATVIPRYLVCRQGSRKAAGLGQRHLVTLKQSPCLNHSSQVCGHITKLASSTEPSVSAAHLCVSFACSCLCVEQHTCVCSAPTAWVVLLGCHR